MGGPYLSCLMQYGFSCPLNQCSFSESLKKKGSPAKSKSLKPPKENHRSYNLPSVPAAFGLGQFLRSEAQEAETAPFVGPVAMSSATCVGTLLI